MSQQQRQTQRQVRNRQKRAQPLPIHSNTAISQENRQIEQALIEELNKYVNLIRRELEVKYPLYKWTQLRAFIIPRLRDSVEQTIRGSLTKSYTLGAEYVTGQVGLGAASFLTHADIDSIKGLAVEYTNKFFGRVQMSLDSTIRKEFAAREPADSLLNPNFIVTSVATSATTKALADGSKYKARALIYNNTLSKSRDKRVIVQAQAEEEEGIAFDDLFFSSGATIESLAAEELETKRWVWVRGGGGPCNADNSCEDLEGLTWGMDELDDMPIPIEETHPHCLCRLLLL